jgi:hypothetical protein
VLGGANESTGDIERRTSFPTKHLPDMESSPDLANVAVEFKKRVDAVRKQIKELQEKT